MQMQTQIAVAHRPAVASGAPVREIHRAVLLVAAATAVAVALTVILGVIPSARDIWVPTTEGSEGTVPALWAGTIANLVFAGLLALAALGRATRRTAVRRLVVVLAAGCLVQALMFLDAGAAFAGGDPEMETATRWVRVAALGDAIAALLVLGNGLAPPATPAGRWSLRLAGAFLVFLVLFFGGVAAGQRGGETFFSNPYLAFTILAAGGAGVAAGAVAAFAIARRHERSPLLVLALLLGLVVLFFAVGETIGHGEPQPSSGGLEYSTGQRPIGRT
jgi:hypothetical protein